MYAEDLEWFGIISPAMRGLVKAIPIIYLKDSFTDSENVYIRDGEVHFAKLRDPDFLDSSDDKSQTPDANPILHFVTFIKQSTGSEYLLAFTKNHIYHWNTSTKVWDNKTPAAGLTDTDHWDTCIYNDMVFATNNKDHVLFWDTTGTFAILGNASFGIIYGYSTGTTVDAESAAAQKVLNVTATTSLPAGTIICIDRGELNEEYGEVATVSAGVSVTLVSNLTKTHLPDVTVEICLRTTKAKYIGTKDNYLILGYPTDDGTARPTRIRWPAIGNENAWDQVGSGAREIGMTGKITGFGEYENNLVVFKDKTIQFVYLVAGDAVWNNYVYSNGIGCEGHHSIINDPEGNLYFFGSDGVFREIKDSDISFAIGKYVRGISPDERELIYAAYNEELGQLWWAVPYNNSYNNVVVAYDRKIKAWFILNIAAPAIGYYHES